MCARISSVASPALPQRRVLEPRPDPRLIFPMSRNPAMCSRPFSGGRSRKLLPGALPPSPRRLQVPSQQRRLLPPSPQRTPNRLPPQYLRPQSTRSSSPLRARLFLSLVRLRRLWPRRRHRFRLLRLSRLPDPSPPNLPWAARRIPPPPHHLPRSRVRRLPPPRRHPPDRLRPSHLLPPLRRLLPPPRRTRPRPAQRHIPAPPLRLPRLWRNRLPHP